MSRGNVGRTARKVVQGSRPEDDSILIPSNYRPSHQIIPSRKKRKVLYIVDIFNGRVKEFYPYTVTAFRHIN